MDNPYKEFSAAVPIEKLHRYGLAPDGTVYFGLLGVDGILRYFEAAPDAISNIAAETHDIARASRHIVSGNDYANFVPSTLPKALSAEAASAADLFEGPFLKIHRAHEHFDRLNDIASRYGARAKLVPVEIKTVGSTTTWRMQLSEKAPGIIPLLIGDVVHNLRSALDILICDIARSRGLGTKLFKFPFAENEHKLKVILGKEHRRIGDDLCQALLELAPYAGGDPLLRGLHDLDILDKHRLMLPVYFSQWRYHDHGRRLSDLIHKDKPEAERPKILYITDMENTPMSVGELLTCEKGEDPLKYYEEIRSPVLIKFPTGPEIPFANAYVIEKLSQVFEKVHTVTLDLAIRFGNFQPPQNAAR